MKINHRLWLLDAQTAPTWNIFRRSLTLPGPKLKGTTNFKIAHPKKQTNKKKKIRGFAQARTWRIISYLRSKEYTVCFFSQHSPNHKRCILRVCVCNIYIKI